VIDGKLPEDDVWKQVTASALHECLTNTFRHACGDTVYTKVTEDEDGRRLIFTNNGNPPEGPIEERGGLKSLRKIAEDAGFTMDIETGEGFRLTLAGKPSC
jgi:signal transduction histidine kinase